MTYHSRPCAWPDCDRPSRTGNHAFCARDSKRARSAEWAAGGRRNLWRAGQFVTPQEAQALATAWEGTQARAIDPDAEAEIAALRELVADLQKDIARLRVGSPVEGAPVHLMTATRVGRILADLAEQSGEMKATIAVKAGLTERTLRRYMAGDSMESLSTAQTIARACGYRLRVVVEPVAQ